MAKIEDIREKLMLDDHHKMERFCAIFLFFVIVLGSMFGICLKIHADNQKLSLSTIALYTSSSKFSLSGDSIRFIQLYRNDDFSKAFIFGQINGGNMSNISTNANDYQMYMTAVQDTEIKGSPVGGIYMFGNTGYIGLYFFNSEGFNPAVYDIVLRNTSMITEVDTSGATDSYGMFNQCHLIANFAGSNGVVADFLNDDNPSLEDMYEELMFTNEIQSRKNQARDILVQMNRQMSLVNEYRDRLINDHHVQVPALPAALAGDRITTDVEEVKDNPIVFDPDMLSSVDSVISTNYFTTVNLGSDGESGTVSNSDLYLVTDYVFPGGYQYNYQDIGLKAGMLDTYMPEGSSYTEWIASKEAESSNYADRVRLRFGDWYDENNEIIESAEGWNIQNQTVLTAISDYTNAVTELYNLKRKYQTSILPKIFEYEMQKNSVASIFSINSSAKTLLLY